MNAAEATADSPQWMMRSPAVVVDRVSKIYPTGARALDDVSVTVARGTFVAVLGPPGAGKSTLVHCAAGLDAPTSGSTRVDGVEIGALSEIRRAELRRLRVGFLFAAHNLMPAMSVADNITLPLRLAGTAPDHDWVRALAERVGLAGRLAHRPVELSGVEQWRVALARAVVARPAVVFADEPTGALHPREAGAAVGLLREVVDGLGQAVVLATRDAAVAAPADRVLLMAGGRVADTVEAPTTAAELARRVTALAPGR
ncbi:ABC transporter ATP-binding protein [Goodfellowiella coeruleoviolacea]|uniref:ABC transport system ATP-binding protein n=1 Tax=Goodfellowiella coeruleoviolacea TaxID=334858 RepID=A0AAE3GL43_9PSEU|nr:ABC transporter ATP-binding protein [Goodfellowiella coeruleoviolacea]MCP2170050.1 putative ABC transport system ATP-binding protein [Goodfellowiella coeruleoviolacea]